MSRARPFFAASIRSRLLAASFLWSAVGLGLAAAGTRWLLASSAGGRVPALIAAGAAGWAKGRYILGPRARKNAERIAGDAGPISLVRTFTPPTWALVVAMMALGYALRHASLPKAWVGWLYAAVGSGLLVGALPAWAAWARSGRQARAVARAPERPLP
jgi:hypothetical protein